MAEQRTKYVRGGIVLRTDADAAVEVPASVGVFELKIVDAGKKQLPAAQIELKGPLSLGGAAGDDGIARFRDLPPGTYKAEVFHPGFEKKSLDVAVAAKPSTEAAAADGDAADGSVSLTAAVGTLDVTVKDTDGANVRGAEVRAVGTAPGNRSVAVADASGVAKLKDLPPSDYELRAIASGLLFAPVKGVKVAVGGNSASITAATSPDLAIDARTALLFSPFGPQARSEGPANDDRRAVWAHVPDQVPLSPPEVFLFFKGYNNFISVSPGANGGVPRVPSWVPADRRGDAAGVLHAGRKYLLKPTPAGGRVLPVTGAVYDGSTHKPIVLAPEDGIPGYTKADIARITAEVQERHRKWVEGGNRGPEPQLPTFFFAKTDFGSYALPSRDPRKPDVPRRFEPDLLSKLLQDCVDRLRRLKNAGTPYLSAAVDLAATKPRRLYITGHSGGGVMITACAASRIAQDLPTDLWIMDATYGTGQFEYVRFANDKAKAGNLGNGATQSRVVIVTKKGNKSGTESHVNQMKPDFTDASKAPDLVAKSIAPIEASYDGPADDAALLTALKNPLVIVRTSLEHDDIPAAFLPFLFRTAA